MSDINESEILDDIITEMRQRLQATDLDGDERNRLYDRLMKAISLRRKERGGRKGRGFDLGETVGHG